MPADGGWDTHRLSGSVGELHGRDPEPHASRQVWLMSPLDAALVLGSAQRAEFAAGQSSGGLAVVRRRSGGGAVLLAPDDSVWIDVVIGRDDPLWEDDVNRAPLWLGKAWAAALASLGIAGGEVFPRYQPGRWGRLACFAGRGPGEVLVERAKAVGISQRRTRTTARFQTLVYRRWEPEKLVDCLAVPPGQLDEFRDAMSMTTWTVTALAEEIQAALVASLPQ
ncbi:lipoyl protein ligase domain-containing protein [Candidatus Poriferisocius sp.]|uniref:lipoyl protein ligase domain-containing protein n=1 Tax=Candidatus Poriferisocius sp. TaxID=3101276 RepID=UPI003B026A6B